MSNNRWSWAVGPHGARVRVRERKRGGSVYLFSWSPAEERNVKTSLGFSVRDAEGDLDPDAVEAAKQAAKNAVARRLQGERPVERTVTLGEAADLFRREVVRELSGRHKNEVGRGVELLENVLGRSFDLTTFGPREWRAIKRDRASGAIDSHGRRVRNPDDRQERSARTVQKTLKTVRQFFSTVADERRDDGSFLLPEGDPTRGLKIPTPKDQSRPKCSDDLLADLLDAAEDVTMRVPGERKRKRVRSYLPEMLTVAAETGCRRGALCALRWSDWDPDPEEAKYGTLTFRGDADKNGRTRTVPVTEACRKALQEQRRRHPGVGEAPIWPQPVDGGPLHPDTATDWLLKAEDAVRDHEKGWGWHALRRRWAMNHKDRSPVDTAALGGWAGPHVMQTVYQRATMEDMERALLGPDDEDDAAEAEAGS